MKEIPLTQSKIALVDDEDYDFLMQFKWHVTAQGYAGTNKKTARDGSRGQFLMHRLIMCATDRHVYVDHRNGIGLDNTRDNLRVCTQSQNCMNRKMQSNNKSGYKGVSPIGNGKWNVRLKVGAKYKFLGEFWNIVDAIVCYDTNAIKHHGEFAWTNFPRHKYESTYLCSHEIRTITDPKPSVDQFDGSKASPVCFNSQWDGSFKRL